MSTVNNTNSPASTIVNIKARITMHLYGISISVALVLAGFVFLGVVHPEILMAIVIIAGVFAFIFASLTVALYIVHILHTHHQSYVAHADEQSIVVVEPQGFLKPKQVTVHFKPVAVERFNYNIKQGYGSNGQIVDSDPMALLPAPIPNYITYDEIRNQIPRGTRLVGVGEGGKVLTRGEDAKSLIAIIGNSGTGKTSGVMLRLDEDYRLEKSTVFLGIDPHYFKDDSLTNAIAGTMYEDRFITLTGEPFSNGTRLASDQDDIAKVLDAFIAEFERRRGGGSWKFYWRLVIDETSTLSYKASTPKEKAIFAKLCKVAQIAGQQSRNFDMGAIMISQQATGMAWLLKMALMIIVYQLLRKAEAMLALNDKTEMVEAMERWPKGRTAVYGIAFESGMLQVQQPVFIPLKTRPIHTQNFLASASPVVNSYSSNDETEMEPLVQRQATEQLAMHRPTQHLDMEPDTDMPPNITDALEAWNNGATGIRELERALSVPYNKARDFYQELKIRGLIEVES